MDIGDSYNVHTGESGYTVHAEVVPEQVVTVLTTEHIIILTCRRRDDIDPIVAAYDPDSASSPPAAESRSIARPIIAHLAGE